MLINELIVKILLSNTKLYKVALQLNKSIKILVYPYLYVIWSKQSITSKEILKVSNSKIIMWDDSNGFDTCIYRCIPSKKKNHVRLRKASQCELCSDDDNLIRIGPVQTEELDYRDFCKKEPKVTIISEYNILKRRLHCMSYNKNYAKKRLIEKYNKYIASDLDLNEDIRILYDSQDDIAF